MIWLEISVLAISILPGRDERCAALIKEVSSRTVNLQKYIAVDPVMGDTLTPVLHGYANLMSASDGHLIRDRLPSFPRAMLGKSTGRNGPNCWNASCNFYQPATGIRHTWVDEMEYILSAEFTPLDSKEMLQFGDLISMWMRSSDDPSKMILMHTMVFLDGEFVFHKANGGSTTPYVIETLTRVFNREGNEYTDEIRFHRPLAQTLATMNDEFSRGGEDRAARIAHFADGNPKLWALFP